MQDHEFPEVVQSDFQESDDVVRMLESIHGIDDDLPERLVAREQWEREYKVGLASLRSALALTQAEVAVRMGVAQTSVSRTEARSDILLSTLNSYLRALGADATLTIRVGDSLVTTDLEHLLSAP